MDLLVLREFFGWMTLVNLAFYMITAIMSVCFSGLVAGISAKMFGVSEAAGRNIIYGYVGGYKLLFITFNLVPWIALVIMT